MAAIALRPARADEAPLVLEMLRATAAEQGNEHELCVTLDDVREDGFGPSPRFDVLLAEADGRAVGMALYFFDYATWTSRNGLYLEDLYVHPAYRRHGIARALMTHLKAIARERGCGRLNWVVQRHNANAVKFYESLGAEPLDEWPLWKLDP